MMLVERRELSYDKGDLKPGAFIFLRQSFWPLLLLDIFVVSDQIDLSCGKHPDDR